MATLHSKDCVCSKCQRRRSIRSLPDDPERAERRPAETAYDNYANKKPRTGPYDRMDTGGGPVEGVPYLPDADDIDELLSVGAEAIIDDATEEVLMKTTEVTTDGGTEVASAPVEVAASVPVETVYPEEESVFLDEDDCDDTPEVVSKTVEVTTDGGTEVASAPVEVNETGGAACYTCSYDSGGAACIRDTTHYEDEDDEEEEGDDYACYNCGCANDTTHYEDEDDDDDADDDDDCIETTSFFGEGDFTDGGSDDATCGSCDGVSLRDEDDCMIKCTEYLKSQGCDELVVCRRRHS